MKIAIVSVTDPNKSGAINKDLAGGLGTYSKFGNSVFARLLSFIKKKMIKLPLFMLANLQAILKSKGFDVQYYEDGFPISFYDVVLVYGSMVDYQYEISEAQKYKTKFNSTRLGFVGDFPSIKPDLYQSADFLFSGEAEAFFLYEFEELTQLNGIIKPKKILNLNDLPTLDYSGFPIKKYSYFPALKDKPVVTMQASRGCPFSCGYYCPYGANQGTEYRLRDPEKIVNDIETLISEYGIKAIIFRDPLFGLNSEHAEKICSLIVQNNIKITWAIETRLDLLKSDKLDLMYEAGLRDVSIGIETINKDVAKSNKRKLIEHNEQLQKIKELQSKGISVNAFYMLGLDDDTFESCLETIEYAKEINTNTAQFTIATPYPGTKNYEEIKKNQQLQTENYEHYDAYSLVFKHKNLSEEQLLNLKEYAFKSYYFRLNYIWEFIKWRIKEFY